MLHYQIGDATKPISEGSKIIAHVCNDIGGWGRGFVLAISKRWKLPEETYRSWNDRALGRVQIVPVGNDTYVANMVAQHDIVWKNGIPPIRYEALRECLEMVAATADLLSASVHMPRIGCGLAGGSWAEVEKIVAQALQNINVYVYDLK